MKSLVYHGRRDIRCEEVADPIISGPGAAIVQIHACGICGSDLHPYHLDMGRSFCIGHEAVGEVVETGPEVSRFKVGDRVLVAGSLCCGACDPCRRGYAMLCERSPYPRVFGQGLPGVGGCQSEAVEVPIADHNLRRLPLGMSDELGVMLTDTLATAWQCAKMGKVSGQGSVAVIGLGAVGLQCVLSAFAMGAEQVFGIDLIEERRQAAAEFGAVPLDGGVALQQIMDMTSGRGVATVLDATGGPQTMELALQIARKGGVISVAGVPESASMPFPIMAALVKNLEINFVTCSVQAQLAEVFEALDAGRLKAEAVNSLITHRLPLAKGPEAYALFDARTDGVKKIILTT